MITNSNKTNKCDTLLKGEDWAMGTQRELATLATMLLGRRPLRFKGICAQMRVMGGGLAGKEAFGSGWERGLSDLVQEIPFGFSN